MKNDKVPIELFEDVRKYLRKVQSRNLVYKSNLFMEQPAVVVTPNKEQVMQQPEKVSHSVAVEQCTQMSDELKSLREEIASCKKCDLAKTRIQTVFGNGNARTDLVFIGEAPGANEDRTGVPFCGAAGNLLNRELEKNGILRSEVFVVNCLKCRPPENRDPLETELRLCEEYLLRQIELISPKILCVLGRFAASVLLKRSVAIMRERGKFDEYHKLPLLICLHPAAILHQPNNRKLFEDDIALLAQRYHQLKNS